MRVVAFGQDVYWLSAVQKAVASLDIESFTVKCSGDFHGCIDSLPLPASNTVLLVDASSQNDMEQTVGRLRSLGWKFVIVVAADPSAKQATAVLRRNLGYDYWEKTYDEDDIRKRVKECFDEITVELPSIKKRPDRLRK